MSTWGSFYTVLECEVVQVSLFVLAWGCWCVCVTVIVCVCERDFVRLCVCACLCVCWCVNVRVCVCVCMCMCVCVVQTWWVCTWVMVCVWTRVRVWEGDGIGGVSRQVVFSHPCVTVPRVTVSYRVHSMSQCHESSAVLMTTPSRACVYNTLFILFVCLLG